MALADRGIKPPTRTKFELWIDSLNESNKAVVLGWLNDAKGFTVTSVADMLREDDAEDDFEGYPATKSTIAQWRKARGVHR